MIFMEVALSELEVPANPLRDAAAHHLLEVLALQPRQLFGEVRDALTVRTGHTGDVGAPEEAVGAVSVEDTLQRIADVAKGIGLSRIGRRGGRLDRNVG